MSKTSTDMIRHALNGPTMGTRWSALFFTEAGFDPAPVRHALQVAVEEVDAPTEEDALPPVPAWTAEPASASGSGSGTSFVGASGEVVTAPVDEPRGAEPGAPALGRGDDQPFVHHNVPLSRMQPEEDEDEMLLEV